MPILISICGFLGVYGQQDSQYTQYMYNTQIVNPAYAGSRGMLSLNALHRAQWVGLDGAPKTYSFTMNTPIGEKNVGLGLSFFRDEIGPSLENNLAVDFSYTIPVSEKTKLSFGLKGGMNILDVDFTRLDIYDPNDADFQTNIRNRVSPTIGTGLYFHTRDTWYIGISSPNLLRTKYYDDIQSSEVTEELHVYAIGGYVFSLNNSLKFKPAFLVKAVSGAPLAVNASANFLLYDKLTLGAAYRLDAAVSGLAGFQISEQLMLGYAYDYDTTELGNYNSGSHEIFLRYEFLTRTRSTVNPRFF